MNKLEDLYNAIAYAETGHLKDPYIRTQARGTGSSAYGPVQINKAALTGPGYKDIGFTPEEHKFIQEKYLPQMDLFLKYGGDDMVEGMERYDYGQKGDFTEEDKSMYENMAKKLMNFEYNRTMKKPGATIDDFIFAWRGESKDKDSRYYQTVKDRLLMNNVLKEQGSEAF